MIMKDWLKNLLKNLTPSSALNIIWKRFYMDAKCKQQDITFENLSKFYFSSATAKVINFKIFSLNKKWFLQEPLVIMWFLLFIFLIESKFNNGKLKFYHFLFYLYYIIIIVIIVVVIFFAVIIIIIVIIIVIVIVIIILDIFFEGKLGWISYFAYNIMITDLLLKDSILDTIKFSRLSKVTHFLKISFFTSLSFFYYWNKWIGEIDFRLARKVLNVQ